MKTYLHVHRRMKIISSFMKEVYGLVTHFGLIFKFSYTT